MACKLGTKVLSTVALADLYAVKVQSLSNMTTTYTPPPYPSPGAINLTVFSGNHTTVFAVLTATTTLTLSGNQSVVYIS